MAEVVEMAEVAEVAERVIGETSINAQNMKKWPADIS